MADDKARSNIVTLSKELLFALFLLAVVLVFRPTKAEAATINVAVGTSVITNDDSICQLEEAIENVNDGVRTYADCVEVGGYGPSNTIKLPLGTITGTGSGSTEVESGSGYSSDVHVTIDGHGKDQSILEDINLEFRGDNVSSISLQDFTILRGDLSLHNAVNTTLDSVEVDGNNQADLMAGITIFDTEQITIRDSYIHNIEASFGDPDGTTLGIGVGIEGKKSGDNGGRSDILIERTTISQTSLGIILDHDIGSSTGYDGSGLAVIDATIRNSTFTDLSMNLNIFPGSGSTIDSPLFGMYSPAGILIMFGGRSNTDYGTINYTTINNTYSNIRNTNYVVTPASAIREVGLGQGRVAHTTQNDLLAVGNGSTVNYGRMAFDTTDSPAFSTTSNGGNVSSDNSLSTWLTQPSDKHSQTSLASFLGALSDNGGAVPTLALLEGSPAINAGTNVAGLTTDAKGGARVLGAASDAGAYESTFNNVVGSAGSTGGKVPGVPNTGLSLLLNNPVATLIMTTVSAALLWFLSRRIKLKRLW